MTAVVTLCGALAATPDDPPPDWAFVIYQKPDDATPPPALVTVPGAKLSVTPKAADDPFDVPDWFPDDHPQLPSVVQHGHAPDLIACSYCHLATGVGSPEDTAVAGLPAAYIEAQIREFRSGRRQCAVPEVEPCGQAMAKVAHAVSPDELRQAAAYFSKLPYRTRIHVVEAAIVPKTRVYGFTLVRIDGAGEEPIGQRVLELPDDLEPFENGDWRTTITAYVPPGSLARGKRLVDSGAGARPCGSCHGARLKGMGLTPPLAGRPPSYIVRQLYDIQHGFRQGPAVAAMLPEVTHLTPEDRIDIAAYLASEQP
ncbi:MAG: c-type cytochrome [Aliidongia sp.]